MKLIRGLPREAKPDEPVSLDLELFRADGNKLHRPTGDFACLSIGFREATYQFDDVHDVREALKRINKGFWCITNSTFDLRQLRRWADIPQRKIWDTLLAEQELFGGYYTQFGLAAQSLRWLGRPMEKETRDEFETATEMDDQKRTYAANDADATLHVAQKQWQHIREEGIAFDYYWKGDEPCIWAVLDMPPVRIDVANWSKLAATFSATAEQAKQQVLNNFGINVASSNQIKTQLSKMTGRNVKDAQDGTLQELKESLSGKLTAANKNAIVLIDLRSEYQHTAKLSSTYGQNWLNDNIENGDQVYSNWKICGATDTARMSSDKPNLQQIPRRRMPIFRTMFLASKGNAFLASDVEQQEPRILAWISKDKHLTEIILAGISPHVALGIDLFGEGFTKKDPRYGIAKSLNLGLDYGLTARGLAQRTGISEDEGEGYIMFYFRKYPGVKGYITKYREFGMRHDYVQTTMGRRCWLNPHNNKWMNNAINAPIQGTAAHMTKISMASMHRLCKENDLPFSLVLAVHDELDSDVPKKLVKTYQKKVLEAAWEIGGKETIPGIPVVIEVSVGDSWACKEN